MAELKEQALLERIGQLTIQYEDRIADLRVELTNVSAALDALQESTNQMHQRYGHDSPVLEGVVV